jgi:HAE1 family hydrophobic/amphiphilic exporter-1
VVGGLIVSQTLTLYVTPVFYVYMEHLQEWLAKRRAVRRPATESGRPPVEGARPAVEGSETGS